ncbi:MAG: PolC-type DNA polymerase III [Peptoniphilus sp.]|nr:PolC-type DNA polymerase III [Peptoniphilus sp.]MDD7362972.1 PolC-type DNA polymerase III [Bacillota bacterium]MDY6044212.1 PolC-type DNA polymerase III [Peptoniphilus sp.]
MRQIGGSSEQALTEFLSKENPSISKLVYHKRKKTITVYMDGREDDRCRDLKELMASCYAGLSINIHAEKPSIAAKEMSRDEIYQFVREQVTSSEAWFNKDCFQLEANILTIRVPNATVEKNISSLPLSDMLYEKTGVLYKINCCLPEDHCALSDLSEKIDTEETAFRTKFEKEVVKTTATESPKSKESGGVYAYGKDKFEAVTPLDMCRPGEMVTVSGVIFSQESRPIKNDKTLFILSIYDGHDSRNVKAFVKNQEAGDFKQTFGENVPIMVHGKFEFDSFDRNESIMARNIKLTNKAEPTDDASETRIEFHVHTKMSNMDGTHSIGDFAKRAKHWGHEAIAITDDNVVQGYPDAMSAAKKYDIRILYGVDADVVDDEAHIFNNPDGRGHDLSYVVFDLETTGFSPRYDEITEIGAVKIKEGRIIDRFSTFVNPERPIPQKVSELTNITDEMVADAETIGEVLPKFEAFVGDSILVAHNASFDSRFIEFRRGEKAKYPTIDTLLLSQCLDLKVKNFKLGTLAKRFGISLQGAHRAVNDAEATAELFLHLQRLAAKAGVTSPESYNNLRHPQPEKLFPDKLTLFPKNLEGLTILYRLISKSHTENFFRTARMLTSDIGRYRDYFVIGSGGEEGRLIDSYLRGADEGELASILSGLDYVEVSPPARYGKSYRDGLLRSEEDAEAMIRDLIELADREGVPVIASANVRYLDRSDETYLRILEYSKFRGRAFTNEGAFFMSTDEMLDAFSFMGDRAREFVVDNPKKVMGMLEAIQPIPSGKFPPEIKNADVDLKRDALNRAKSIYGDPLPDIVSERLDKELDSIIGNGYAVMYRIAQQLVQKSNDDGFYVGSRGSVGSSFVATMTGITEVNPLAPHYVCPNCQYSEFVEDKIYSTGFDLPKKNCPHCGTPLHRDGHKIPFEVFLGFYGDKEPDIDLNFAGEYQPEAHQFIEDYFGEGYVFRAGTIGTLAEKTAFGLVKKYLEENGIDRNPVDIFRLAKGIEGVKRTSGQHPGGIMIVPKDEDIHHFTPIQYPADEKKKNVITTHFDYHSISENILKLDILGHDAPSILRMLEDLTGVDMNDVDVNDKNVMSLFTGIGALNIDEELFTFDTGTLGIPEFGTDFVVRMLLDTKPSTFGELVNISGLSHGTDVWTGNAQELVHSNRATISEVISTREDIMNYLILAGAENKVAFDTMEAVRKGRGLPEKYMDVLETLEVPEWYFDSCKKIKYMFPRAHAVAYVLTSIRIAWYKVYYPLAFYASYFTTKLSDLNGDLLVGGFQAVKRRMEQIDALGKNATKKEQEEYSILRVVLEMFARGYEFEPIRLDLSHYEKFDVHEGKVLLPLSSLSGIGRTVAKEIYDEYRERPFLSVEDMIKRTGASKAVVEALDMHGALEGLPKDNQLSMLDLIGSRAKI